MAQIEFGQARRRDDPFAALQLEDTGGQTSRVPFGTPQTTRYPSAEPPRQTAFTGDPSSFFNEFTRGLDPTTDNLRLFYDALRGAGQNVNWATRAGGEPSDDKFTLDGRMGDFIRDVGGPNAAWQWMFEDPAQQGSGGGGNAGSELLLNEALNRLQQLRQPVNDPFRALLELNALKRAESLQGSQPYTQGEDDALRARYMEPLTQARDAALERQQENLGRYGYLPSSGLAFDQRNKIEQGYQRSVAQGSNDLAVRAIDERQRREAEALDILSALVDLQRQGRGEEDDRAAELLRVAAIPRGLDVDDLQLLLQASGEGASNPQSAVNSLLTMNQQNQNQQNFDRRYDQLNTEALMEAIGRLVENWGS